MAKILPARFDPPRFIPSEPFAAWETRSAEYIQRLKDWIKTNYGEGEYIGEEINFPVGDGYARYLIVSLKPATLMHVPLGDAWNFPYAHRLTVKDIRAEAERTAALRKLFSKENQ